SHPGPACDVPTHHYSNLYEPNPRWSRAYDKQAEILAYLEHCADKHRLRSHLRFGEAVHEAVFERDHWRVTTSGGTYTARALLLGNGAVHVPQLPDVRRLATFPR